MLWISNNISYFAPYVFGGEKDKSPRWRAWQSMFGSFRKYSYQE